MSQYLFLVEQKNRLSQRGLLKRFSIKCYGKQSTLESMRSEKAMKYNELKNKRGTKEYEFWFLKYNPSIKDFAIEKNKKSRKRTNKRRATNNGRKTRHTATFFENSSTKKLY